MSATTISQSDHHHSRRTGWWSRNPVLVQALGLSPLLAMSNSAVKAVSLGLATLLVVLGSNVTLFCCRRWLPESIRLPVLLMVVAAFVTGVEWAIAAWSVELQQSLGIFIALILTNSWLIAQAETVAYCRSVTEVGLDGLLQGLGFMLVLVLFGLLREFLGTGGVFAQAELFWGDWAQGFSLQLWQFEQPLLVALLPPGAFMGLGLLMAANNAVQLRQARRQPPTKPPVVERVRVTGMP